MTEDTTRPRGKGLRISRRTNAAAPGVPEYVPRSLSDHDTGMVRDTVAHVRARMKELFGVNEGKIVDLRDLDHEWVKKKLAPSEALSLSNALRILNALESYVAPFSPLERRNGDVNEVLFWIRKTRMELLEAYDIHPEYEAIATAMRQVLMESGAVDSAHDPRIEQALRPFRDLLRSVREQLVVADADGDALATLDLMPDPLTEGKLRTRRYTAVDGSTVSTFEGGSQDWMKQFTAPPLLMRFNPDLLDPAEGACKTGAVSRKIRSLWKSLKLSDD